MVTTHRYHGFFNQVTTMKEFCFWDEDDLENLPADFKLVPFNVAYYETPKTSTSRMSPQARSPSPQVKQKSCKATAFD